MEEKSNPSNHDDPELINMQQRKSRPSVLVSEYVNETVNNLPAFDKDGAFTSKHKEITHINVKGDGFADLACDHIGMAIVDPIQVILKQQSEERPKQEQQVQPAVVKTEQPRNPRNLNVVEKETQTGETIKIDKEKPSIVKVPEPPLKVQVKPVTAPVATAAPLPKPEIVKPSTAPAPVSSLPASLANNPIMKALTQNPKKIDLDTFKKSLARQVTAEHKKVFKLHPQLQQIQNIKEESSLSVPTARTLFESAFKDKYMEGIRLDPDIGLKKQINQNPLQSQPVSIIYQTKPEKVDLGADSVRRQQTDKTDRTPADNTSTGIKEAPETVKEETQTTEHEPEIVIAKEAPKSANIDEVKTQVEQLTNMQEESPEQEEDQKTQEIECESDSSDVGPARRNAPKITISMLGAVENNLKQRYLEMLSQVKITNASDSQTTQPPAAQEESKQQNQENKADQNTTQSEQPTIQQKKEMKVETKPPEDNRLHVDNSSSSSEPASPLRVRKIPEITITMLDAVTDNLKQRFFAQLEKVKEENEAKKAEEEKKQALIEKKKDEPERKSVPQTEEEGLQNYRNGLFSQLKAIKAGNFQQSPVIQTQKPSETKPVEQTKQSQATPTNQPEPSPVVPQFQPAQPVTPEKIKVDKSHEPDPIHHSRNTAVFKSPQKEKKPGSSEEFGIKCQEYADSYVNNLTKIAASKAQDKILADLALKRELDLKNNAQIIETPTTHEAHKPQKIDPVPIPSLAQIQDIPTQTERSAPVVNQKQQSELKQPEPIAVDNKIQAQTHRQAQIPDTQTQFKNIPAYSADEAQTVKKNLAVTTLKVDQATQSDGASDGVRQVKIPKIQLKNQATAMSPPAPKETERALPPVQTQRQLSCVSREIGKQEVEPTVRAPKVLSEIKKTSESQRILPDQILTSPPPARKVNVNYETQPHVVQISNQDDIRPKSGKLLNDTFQQVPPSSIEMDVSIRQSDQQTPHLDFHHPRDLSESPCPSNQIMARTHQNRFQAAQNPQEVFRMSHDQIYSFVEPPPQQISQSSQVQSSPEFYSQPKMNRQTDQRGQHLPPLPQRQSPHVENTFQFEQQANVAGMEQVNAGGNVINYNMMQQQQFSMHQQQPYQYKQDIPAHGQFTPGDNQRPQHDVYPGHQGVIQTFGDTPNPNELKKTKIVKNVGQITVKKIKDQNQIKTNDIIHQYYLNYPEQPHSTQSFKLIINPPGKRTMQLKSSIKRMRTNSGQPNQLHIDTGPQSYLKNSNFGQTIESQYVTGSPIAMIQRPKSGILQQLPSRKSKVSRKLGTLIIPVTPQKQAEEKAQPSFIQLDVSLKNVHLFPEANKILASRKSAQHPNPYYGQMSQKQQIRIFKTKKNLAGCASAQSLKNISPYLNKKEMKMLSELNHNRYFPEGSLREIPKIRSQSTLNSQGRVRSQHLGRKINDHLTTKTTSSFRRHIMNLPHEFVRTQRTQGSQQRPMVLNNNQIEDQLNAHNILMYHNRINSAQPIEVMPTNDQEPTPEDYQIQDYQMPSNKFVSLQVNKMNDQLNVVENQRQMPIPAYSYQNSPAGNSNKIYFKPYGTVVSKGGNGDNRTQLKHLTKTISTPLFLESPVNQKKSRKFIKQRDLEIYYKK